MRRKKGMREEGKVGMKEDWKNGMRSWEFGIRNQESESRRTDN
jgi:hypothetical protein